MISFDPTWVVWTAPAAVAGVIIGLWVGFVRALIAHRYGERWEPIPGWKFKVNGVRDTSMMVINLEGMLLMAVNVLLFVLWPYLVG